MASYPSTLALLICLIGAVLAGCSGDEPEPLAVTELDCQATIDVVDTPPDYYQTVLDAVALPGPATVHEIGRIDESSGLGFARTRMCDVAQRDRRPRR